MSLFEYPAALERISREPRLAHLSDVAHVLLATAWADGAPLRPITVPAELELLALAELHVRHGADPRAALTRARAEDAGIATLRGAVHHASSRLARDELRVELERRGIRSVSDLDGYQAAELALWLYGLPADEPDEEATIALLEELSKPEPEPELETEVRGAVLGGCYRCGNPVGDDDLKIGVYYHIAGRTLADGTVSEGRFEWRTFSPAIERGDYDPADKIKKRAGKERRSELLKQARAGAHLLCSSCAGRVQHGLIEPPTLADELDQEWLDAVARDTAHDREPGDVAEADLAGQVPDEGDAIASPSEATQLAGNSAMPKDDTGIGETTVSPIGVSPMGDVVVSWPPANPPLDEEGALEAAISAVVAELFDRRRLEAIRGAYPEFAGRRGDLLAAIAALAWEFGRPLHLRTNLDDVVRLGRLVELALNGASVARALTREAA